MKRCIILYCFSALLLAGQAAAQPSDAVLHQLDASTYDSVKTMLKKAWIPALKDTIIIHYQQQVPADMGMLNDEKIQQNITDELRFLHTNLVWRKNLDIFQYAADNAASNKLKEFNNLLIIDTGNELNRLLFSEQPASSVIILPDRKCIYLTGNQKWMALGLSPANIKQICSVDFAKLQR